jgi:SAM-dependent methyltransferase
MEWYSFVYRTSYRLGFTPWDRGVPASGLVELIDGNGALPKGRAIDLGCGTGTNSIYLAQRGWRVTGIDMVPCALDAARRRALRAGVSPAFIQGDVTRLGELSLGAGFNLVVDVGCFHTLPAGLRDRYVESVSAVAVPGATLFLFAFSPRKLAPIKSGVSLDEVERRFKGWRVAAFGPASDGTTTTVWRGRAARYFSPWQYRLKREPQP